MTNVRPGDDENYHTHAPHRVLRRVVGVDRNGEEERLRAAGQRGESVAAREPRAHVRARARAQLRHSLRVGDDHPCGDYLTDEVSEALGDAARRGAVEADHALRRDVDQVLA
jgi:hypothetical protein